MNAEREKVLDRLRRIEGQIRGFQRMVENEAPCVDILTQVSAVTAGMKNTGNAMVQNHSQQCVHDASRGSNEVMEEFQKALARYIRMA